LISWGTESNLEQTLLQNASTSGQQRDEEIDRTFRPAFADDPDLPPRSFAVGLSVVASVVWMHFAQGLEMTYDVTKIASNALDSVGQRKRVDLSTEMIPTL
jgi:hypothetical protein